MDIVTVVEIFPFFKVSYYLKQKFFCLIITFRVLLFYLNIVKLIYIYIYIDVFEDKS